MKMITKFYQSTVGKKVVVALTGLVLFGFLAAHMLGNLKSFAGLDPQSGIHRLDLYAHFLRTAGHEFAGNETILWIARVVLLLSAVLHVVTVVQLQLRNRASRPDQYVSWRASASSLAARTMMFSGLVIAAFIIFHILHFTVGTLHTDGFVEGRVYANVHSAFKHWYLAFGYVVVMILIGFHLYHGVWSLFQTLGIDRPSRNGAIRAFAAAFAVVLVVGFSSVPLGVFFGLLPAPSQNFLESSE